MVAIDIRHGLPESRIRAFCPLPDGRMAIATAAYMNVFDGASFISSRIDNVYGVPLGSKGKTRRISHDSVGNIWLKMPATRLEAVETLHIFDPISCEDVTLATLSPEIRNDILDIYLDDDHQIWMIDTLFTLSRLHGNVKTPIINIKSVNDKLPYSISSKGGNIYLCYEDASICVINIPSGLLVFKGSPIRSVAELLPTNAGAKWGDGRLFTSFHYGAKRDKILISSLDTIKWAWDSVVINELVNDYLVNDNGDVIVDFDGVEDEVFRVALDKDSGIWLGTKDNGIRYINYSRQNLVKIDPVPFPYSHSENYVSQRAANLGSKLAPGGVNCSAEDSIDRFIYLGTSNGLMILDSDDELVAVLGQNVGLPSKGIQSVIVAPYSGSILNDSTASIHEVWFTTTTTLSRMRHIDSDLFEVLTIGMLDGLNLNGSELYPQSLVRDSAGHIVTSYPGGTITVNPSDIIDEKYVIHHFPENEDSRVASVKISHHSKYLIITGICLLALALALFLSQRENHSKSRVDQCASSTEYNESNAIDVNSNIHPASLDIEKKYDDMVAKYNRGEATRNGQVEAADREFVERLNKIIVEHIGDDELNVVTLSKSMAMDRTNLYRKMQSVFGKSPSVYIKEIRLSAAAKLLRETEMPIPEIARQTGFSSSKYFSTSFKESYGSLPNKYRQANKPSV